MSNIQHFEISCKCQEHTSFDFRQPFWLTRKACMGFVPDRQAPRKCELRNTTCPQVLCGVATDLPKQM